MVKLLSHSDLQVALYVKKQRPKNYQGILRCRPKNSEAVAMRSGAHGGLMCPLEKGVSGDWDGSSDAGPELAGREAIAAMESPQALIAPLERGCPLKKSVWMIREFNKSSSDDRPGPGICTSKYVEDAKAARSVRVWGSAPIQKKESPQTNV